MASSQAPATAAGSSRRGARSTDGSAGRRRVAYLSPSSFEFDSRTQRMALSAVAHGYDVVVYAPWEPGSPWEESRDGYRVVRVSNDWRFAVPLLRWRARRLYRALRERSVPDLRERGQPAFPDAGTGASPPLARRRLTPREKVAFVLRWLSRPPRRLARGAVRPVWRWFKRWAAFWFLYPLRWTAWARAFDDVAEHADVWHGMRINSLAAVVRLRRRLGGRAIYDSRDMYLFSREVARLHGPRRSVLVWAERRWARACDAVLTTNEAYSRILADHLRVAPPTVVMNCPERHDPEDPPPDRFRERLRLPATTGIVLYQGALMTERGIEQGMDAILEIPDAVLVLMGYGRLESELAARVAAPPYRGRVFLLPAVPPSELLSWTSSADVMLMAIQPTTLNHRYTTPNKLFEAMAAGVPVVASDLPGMARIVHETGCGVVCDPTSPSTIAAAIRSVLVLPADERRELRARALAAAHARYNWAAQLQTLLALYRRLDAPAPQPAPVDPGVLESVS